MSIKMFSCDFDEFKSAVFSALNYLDSKSRDRINCNILLKTVDNKLHVQGQSHHKIGIDITLHAQVEIDILKLLDTAELKLVLEGNKADTVIMSMDDETDRRVSLQLGNRIAYIPIFDIDDYPDLLTPFDGFEVKFDNRELNYLIKRVIFAWDKKTPTVLGYAALDVEGSKAKMTMSDTSVLAIATCKLFQPLEKEGKFQFLVPGNVLTNLLKEEIFSRGFMRKFSTEISFLFNGNEFCIKFGKREIRGMVGYTSYPEVSHIIAERYATTITVNKNNFSDSIQHCYNGNRKFVILDAKDSTMNVQTFKGYNEVDLIVDEPIPVNLVGLPASVLLNPVFIKNVLRELGINESDEPIRIYDLDDPDYIYIVSPFRHRR